MTNQVSEEGIAAMQDGIQELPPQVEQHITRRSGSYHCNVCGYAIANGHPLPHGKIAGGFPCPVGQLSEALSEVKKLSSRCDELLAKEQAAIEELARMREVERHRDELIFVNESLAAGLKDLNRMAPGCAGKPAING